MKNVLLIGDSIRVGYDKAVRQSLEGLANVCFPEENCRFASYTLRYLHEYKSLLPDGKADVIHWNAGLWDCLRLFGEDPHTPLEVYRYYIDRICKRLQSCYPGAAVVFATSTQVLSEKMDKDFKRYNEEIEVYNSVAVETVKQYGFGINDLYAVSAALPEEAHSDAVHYYTPMGTEAFANQVLRAIVPLLGIEENITYQEVMHTDAPIGI